VTDPIEEVARQWARHGWDGGARLVAALSIIRSEELIRHNATRILRPLELSYARHELLALLYFTKAGELPMGKVSQRLMIHPKSVTTTVDSLEKLGFVERVPHPADRRAILARITDAGREIVERSTPQLLEADFGLEGLSETDLRALVRILRKLRRLRGDY
jgi:DNA-binding MarR family transcriptional regulator